MTGPDERSELRGSGRSTGRLLAWSSLALAVLAAAALAVGADDARVLRLGVVVALWAGLIGAFAAVRMRREVTAGSERIEDLRTIYRLELQREVAARREHELAVERDLRHQIQQDSGDEIDSLRAELRTLRENLQQLLGGEVLVERVALRAESTRLRSLPEQPARSRPLAVGSGSAGGSTTRDSRTGTGERSTRNPDQRTRAREHGGSATPNPAGASASGSSAERPPTAPPA
ncbi:MAG: DUF6779 domain-containing protein, partial [Pseudonocardiaceae bacterium]